MALSDWMRYRLSESSSVMILRGERREFEEIRRGCVVASGDHASDNVGNVIAAYFPNNVVLWESRHEEFELSSSSSSSHLVPNWRPRRRMKTGIVALVLCLNIGVDPPDVMKISPCARLECWIDPFSMAPTRALRAIGDALYSQYRQLQPRAHYKVQLDPTVDEVQRLCTTCRTNAGNERILFHYNGHGVPKPTSNGEIWVFNRGYAQYIPLPISDLDSWLKAPSIYIFDCPAAGKIITAFMELQDHSSSGSSTSSIQDSILLAACQAHESLPQSADFPADLFTSCLTTPIKVALTWMEVPEYPNDLKLGGKITYICEILMAFSELNVLFLRSLFRGSLDSSLIDELPGSRNDRKTLLGELNWIFTAVTDTIAWNVLPHDLFQRLFRQDQLVASLFRNYLLAERIMRFANCSPITYPLLPPMYQHHLWDAWDMAAEVCLLSFVKAPEAEYQPSSFFDEQLTAFEVWLEYKSQHKKLPELLPIILWVLPSHSHQCRALMLLGKFLDLGPWAVNLALSVGIYPYVLKLLQISREELRQNLVYVWTKILTFDKSCQADLVKDGAHAYFIKFMDSSDTHPKHRAMATFILAILMDGNIQGQKVCMDYDLLRVCLKYLQPNNLQTEPQLLQWLCLCLGKLLEGYPEAQVVALQADGPKLLVPLLSKPQPEVRASATFAIGMLCGGQSTPFLEGREDNLNTEVGLGNKGEMDIFLSLLSVVSDGSPLVRLEAAVALGRFALRHKRYLKSAAVIAFGKHFDAACVVPPTSNDYRIYKSCYTQSYCQVNMAIGQRRVFFSCPTTSGVMDGSPESEDSSQYSDSEVLHFESNRGLPSLPSSLEDQQLDGELYFQFVSAFHSLARDPSPRVARLGKHILELIGIDHLESDTRWNCRSSSLLGDLWGHLPTSNHARPARSSSWFDLSTVTAPQQHLRGMRRVFSWSHLANSQNLGLADPVLGAGESLSVEEHYLLSQSAIYNWSCGQFSTPLLNTVDDGEEFSVKREKREKHAVDCIGRWKDLTMDELSDNVVCWDANLQASTTEALLEPFSPILIAADETEQIRIWNYEENTMVNGFQNHKYPVKGVSKLCLLNELEDSLLLVASCDGTVRVWKDYCAMAEQKLVTAFSSIRCSDTVIQNLNAVVDWQQVSGYLYASGKTPLIMLWDLEEEHCLNAFPSSSEQGISTLCASQVHGSQLAAGFEDGSIRIYDIRTPDMIVSTYQSQIHSINKVVGLGFQPGPDPWKIVSASEAGVVQFLDMRKPGDPYLSITAYKGSLTALAVHRHVSILATGSATQFVKVFNFKGELLSLVEHRQTLMSQRIGPVSCLTFHPYEVMLAAGASDAVLST